MEPIMEATVERCAGLDIHQASAVACVLAGPPGCKPRKEVRPFGTATQNLWRRATNGLIPGRCGTDRGSSLMSDARRPVPATALDHEGTIVAVVELSARSWLVGAQVAGVPRQCRQKLAPSAAALLEHLDHLRRRAEGAGKRVGRVVLAYEAGRDGFWLARWLIGRGIEVYVIQPSSVPVERRARRAKTDALDVEMLLRASLAWLRGEPRVCSMVPIPGEAEEDGRRPLRERQDLIRERLAITNGIDGLLATLGGAGYPPLRRDPRERLEALRQPGGGALPAHAKARLARLLDRLELVLEQIRVLEEARDAAVARDAGPGGEAEGLARPAGGPERDRPGAGHLAGLGGV